MVRDPDQATLSPADAAPARLDRLPAQLRIQLHGHPGHPQRGRPDLLLERGVGESCRRLLGEVLRRSGTYLLHELRGLQHDVVHRKGIAQKGQREGPRTARLAQRFTAGLHPYDSRQERTVPDHAHRAAVPVDVDVRSEARHVLRHRRQLRLRIRVGRHGRSPAVAERERRRQPVLHGTAPATYHREQYQQTGDRDRGHRPGTAEREAHRGDRQGRLDEHHPPQQAGGAAGPRDRAQSRLRGRAHRWGGSDGGRLVATLPS